MAYATTSPCKWSAKRYILAALAGTLVLSVVIIVVSVVLSPANVHFSITSTWSNYSTTPAGRKLNLTLTANNKSHRAGVKYRSVIVTLWYTPNAIGPPTSSRLDQVSPPSWQSPGSAASINVSVFFPDAVLKSNFIGTGENTTLISVLLDTVVRFKYGRVYTRSYNIRVMCDPVDYFSRLSPVLPIFCNDA